MAQRAWRVVTLRKSFRRRNRRLPAFRFRYSTGEKQLFRSPVDLERNAGRNSPAPDFGAHGMGAMVLVAMPDAGLFSESLAGLPACFCARGLMGYFEGQAQVRWSGQQRQERYTTEGACSVPPEVLTLLMSRLTPPLQAGAATMSARPASL